MSDLDPFGRPLDTSVGQVVPANQVAERMAEVRRDDEESPEEFYRRAQAATAAEIARLEQESVVDDPSDISDLD